MTWKYWDVAIAILGFLVQCGLAWLGLTLTHGKRKALFIGLVIVGAIFTGFAVKRGIDSSDRIQAQLNAIQRNTERPPSPPIVNVTAPPAVQPTHRSGEGFMKIAQVAKNPERVVDVGSPVNFEVVTTNTGQEAVNNAYMFNSFIPVGEKSPEFPQMSDSQVIKKFHELRDEAVADQKKSGFPGLTIGPGEQRIAFVGTRDKIATQALVDSFYAKRTKIYVLGWVEWKSLDHVSKHNENCVWLEPPNPPTPNPDKLWWNECDQP